MMPSATAHETGKLVAERGVSRLHALSVCTERIVTFHPTCVDACLSRPIVIPTAPCGTMTKSSYRYCMKPLSRRRVLVTYMASNFNYPCGPTGKFHADAVNRNGGHRIGVHSEDPQPLLFQPRDTGT
jgi:hypothetical protein